MNILRFLICSGRLGGPQRISTRQMTVTDNLLQCYSYVCQDKAEFDKLSKEYVAKSGKRFWGDVDVFNTETKKRSKVTDIESITLTASTWQERLQLEYHTHRERTGKLNDFILTSPGFSQMAPEMRDLLQKQHAAMQDYLSTLKQRMELCQVPPLVPEVHANVAAHEPEIISQTPGDSQSGGEQSPAESMGTPFNDEGRMMNDEGTQPPVIDIAADLAANGAPAPEADAVGAGQEQEAEVNDEPPAAAAPPTSTPPAPKPAKPAAKKKGK